MRKIPYLVSNRAAAFAAHKALAGIDKKLPLIGLTICAVTNPMTDLASTGRPNSGVARPTPRSSSPVWTKSC